MREVEAHLNRSMKEIIKSFNIYDIKIDRFYFFSSQTFSFNSSTATQLILQITVYLGV